MRLLYVLRKSLYPLALALACVSFAFTLGGAEFPTPLSVVVRIPLYLYYSSVSVAWFWVLAVIICACCVLFLLCAWKHFAVKWRYALLPIFALGLDLYGEILCYQSGLSADKELLTAYYYFNDVQTILPFWYLVAAAADLVLIVLLILAPILHALPKRTKRVSSPAPEEAGITTDNWSEILNASPDAAETAGDPSERADENDKPRGDGV